jgi:hypothetical protein
MNKHYTIYKKSLLDSSITELGTIYQFCHVESSINSFKYIYPDHELYYETIETSDVRKGFGRDPELH